MPTPEQQKAIDSYLESYEKLMGFVPPRVSARFARLSETNPDLLLAQEKVRELVAYNDALDEKTTQLILFAVLAVNLRDAAKLHGLAAKRAGATWEELQATLDLAYLFGGVSVANHAPQILDEIAAFEARNTENGK